MKNSVLVNMCKKSIWEGRKLRIIVWCAQWSNSYNLKETLAWKLCFWIIETKAIVDCEPLLHEKNQKKPLSNCNSIRIIIYIIKNWGLQLATYWDLNSYIGSIIEGRVRKCTFLLIDYRVRKYIWSILCMTGTNILSYVGVPRNDSLLLCVKWHA